MSVKDHYQDVIREIMGPHNISRVKDRPPYDVDPQANCQEVLRYTDYYVGKGNDELPGKTPHYRYERYLRALQYLSKEGGGINSSVGKLAHVDIACGPGVFSWPLLDWATEKYIGLGNVDLYGFDRCSAMIDLAKKIRDGLSNRIADYPNLHYYRDRDVEILLRELENNHQKDTRYLISLGYVLVQVYDQENPDETIDQFARVVEQVCKLIGKESICNLVAVDATSCDRPCKFNITWDRLIETINERNIRVIKSHQAKSFGIASLRPV